MTKRMLLAAAFALAVPAARAAEATWCFQAFGGDFWSVPAPLTIRQDGQPDIKINDAEYETKSFQKPPYYSVRVGRWQDERAWEVELVHPKLYLEDPPPEVQEFSVSHGYNFLTLNRAWKERWFIWRLGLGAVITHPESTVRGKHWEEDGGLLIDDGYYLSGPVGQAAIERRFYLYKGLFASLEAKGTVSWAHFPIEDGHAELWNFALHGLFGLGLDL